MPGLPALGPRGEGWVAIQSVLLVMVGSAGSSLPSGGPMPRLVVGAGQALMVVGLLLAAAGIQALASHDAFTALPRPRQAARLVETGIYRQVRNPVYGGLVLIGLGWALVRGSVAALAADAVLLLFFDLKRRREEAWLVERFPGYAAYRARTRRLIPWLY
jgi:protein-S-isoprenylcysteine O-methyltransferase Ste14